jgi:hypothetical protein
MLKDVAAQGVGGPLLNETVEIFIGKGGRTLGHRHQQQHEAEGGRQQSLVVAQLPYQPQANGIGKRPSANHMVHNVLKRPRRHNAQPGHNDNEYQAEQQQPTVRQQVAQIAGVNVQKGDIAHPFSLFFPFLRSSSILYPVCRGNPCGCPLVVAL